MRYMSPTVKKPRYLCGVATRSEARFRVATYFTVLICRCFRTTISEISRKKEETNRTTRQHKSTASSVKERKPRVAWKHEVTTIAASRGAHGLLTPLRCHLRAQHRRTRIIARVRLGSRTPCAYTPCAQVWGSKDVKRRRQQRTMDAEHFDVVVLAVDGEQRGIHNHDEHFQTKPRTPASFGDTVLLRAGMPCS